MTVGDKGSNAGRGNVGHGPGESRNPRLPITAAVVSLAVLLAGGAQWSQRDASTALESAPQPKAEAQAVAATFDYFPARYENQAKEVEEYIQPF